MSDASGAGRPPGLINRLGEGLTQFVLAIAAVSLLSIVAINGANVVARYLFRSPFPWGEELMLFLNGRRSVAQVEITGPDDALAAVDAAKLGV